MTALERIAPGGLSTGTRVRSGELAQPGFEAALERLLDPPPPEPEGDEASTDGVRLSRHAESRLASRGLSFGEEERAQLSEALTALQGRQARKALVLTGDRAWIVGVERRTVVTVMSRTEALGQVFTDLDSTYVAG
ncbi:MAG TPA: hypothetical protein ENK18_13280 [Deltaproteobacteria bacterium]|nr:hypothetical protein [Deltaproteobacteria bacterium]